MKHFAFMAFAVYAYLCPAQIDEDFSTSSLQHWIGDSSKFTVNTAQQLQSTTAAAGSAWLCTPYSLKSNSTLSFWINLAFAPSSTTTLRLYVYANSSVFDSISEGLYLAVGESGTKDSYDFYLQRKGKSDSLLFAGADGWAAASNNKARFKIEPFQQSYQLYLDRVGGNAYTIIDTLPQYFGGAGYFGIYCTYSASNSNKFYFDDIEITDLGQKPNTANYGDVVINEIMADPTPSIGLPEEEYIELYNKSTLPIPLKNWSISVNNNATLLPNVLMTAGQYFTLYSISALLNEGCTITLRNASGDIVHEVKYSDSWYGDPFKSQGGWSLEMKDASKPCMGADNWMASTNSIGGTPNALNSVAQIAVDSTAPSIVFATLLDSSTLHLQFSEPIYYLQKTNIQPETLADTVLYSPRPNDEITIHLLDHLLSSTLYHITIAVSDCAKNTLVQNPFPFALPEIATQNDVVINEILFNPLGDGADFIELYNRSSKNIDLSALRFSGRDAQGFLTPATILCAHTQLLLPSTYAAFTIDPENIASTYPARDIQNIFGCPTLPALNNDAGNIALIHPNGTVISEMQYIDKMHDGLLSSTDGVSLERIRPNLNSWHSAAESIGYATPGLKNSQYLESNALNSEFKLSSKVFTPNQDGNKDFADVLYQFDKAGYKASILLFDANGKKCKTIADNILLATSGDFQWNGTDDANQPLPVGIYIFYVEYFHPDGTFKLWKESIALQR